LGQLRASITGAEAEARSILNRAVFDEIVKTKVKVGSKTCSCSFTFTVKGNKVSKYKAKCNKKCSGLARGLNVTGESGNTYSFGLTVKKGKAKLDDLTVDLGDA
jgi:hypothetical protein